MIRDANLRKIYRLLYEQATDLTLRQRSLPDVEDPRDQLEQLRSFAFSRLQEGMRGPFPHERLMRTESVLPEGADYHWRFYPIEERHNFIVGSSRWTLAISGHLRQRLHKALVIEGNRNDHYWTRRNGGCYGKTGRLRVSNVADLKRAALGCDVRQGLCPALPQLMRKSARTINSGSDLLNAIDCAAGRVDLFVARCSLPLMRIAALFIEEAGGLVCDEKSQPLNDSSQAMLAANTRLFSALLDEIR